jgi:hypothetical protein
MLPRCPNIKAAQQRRPTSDQNDLDLFGDANLAFSE